MRWLASGLRGCWFAFVCALLPFPAQAQCKFWDVSGIWELQQDNDIVVELSLQQGGRQQQSANLSGTGTLALRPGASSSFTNRTREERTGIITGNITGNAFTILLEINNAKGDHIKNRYTGSIDSSGKMEGTTTVGVATKIRWVSSRALKCADRGSGATTPPGSSASAPTISANPKVATGGSTTLTWDGGPQHPYAEVWVAINGQDPTFVVEQGKGSRRVAVEPGKTYRYILTDSGQDLATVNVR